MSTAPSLMVAKLIVQNICIPSVADQNFDAMSPDHLYVGVPLARFYPHRNLEADRTQEYIWSGFKDWIEILQVDPNRFTSKFYYVEII